MSDIRPIIVDLESSYADRKVEFKYCTVCEDVFTERQHYDSGHSIEDCVDILQEQVKFQKRRISDLEMQRDIAMGRETE